MSCGLALHSNWDQMKGENVRDLGRYLGAMKRMLKVNNLLFKRLPRLHFIMVIRTDFLTSNCNN